MVPVVNQSNNNNVVSDSCSESNDKEAEKNFLDNDVYDKVETTPKTTINAKVHAMKKLQALYNNDANKIIKQATKEKSTIKNLNFFIDLAIQ